MAEPVIDPTAALAFLWGGQEGFFELARDLRQRIHLTRDEALAALDGNRYFAPLARKRKGSTKEDVAGTGNVLWADIDHLNAPNRAQKLKAYGVTPSLMVYSGNKGYWLYLKLSRPIATEEIEAMNRGLAALVDGDACWNRSRPARLPGSINPNTGNRARVVQATLNEYDPAALEFLRQTDTGADNVSMSPLPRLDYHSFPAFPVLGKRASTYIRQRPRRNQGYDRSVEEQRIFTALIRQGWTDEQIIGFANAVKLPRHMEEVARNRDSRWIARSLAKARAHLKNLPPSSITKRHMCRESVTYAHVDPDLVLRNVHGLTISEAIEKTIELSGCSKRTAQRRLKQLHAGGYVKKHRDGRTKRLYHTPRAETYLRGKLRRSLWLPPLAQKRDRRK